MSHPTNITELRSFLEAYNQLRMYLPDFAHTVEDMNKLLKKDTLFVWDVTLQKQFEKIKEILKSPLGLKPFNKTWETILSTDYSSKGVGYALTQENPENRTLKQLIYCGSSALSEKQRRFPAIYGENLAIITGLKKCGYWLRGCPHFTIKTNQKPLESIYNLKPLDNISDEISDIVVSTYKYIFPSNIYLENRMNSRITSAKIPGGTKKQKTWTVHY